MLLSGGLRNWIPQSANQQGEVYQQLQTLTHGDVGLKSKRKDERNLLLEAKDLGYSLAFNKQMLEEATGSKVLGLFASSGMADGIEYSKTKEILLVLNQHCVK